MKVTAKNVLTTTISGEISEAELLAYFKQTVQVPDGMHVRFFVGDPPHDVDINIGEPIRFTFTFSREVADAPLPPDVTTPTG